ASAEPGSQVEDRLLEYETTGPVADCSGIVEQRRIEVRLRNGARPELRSERADRVRGALEAGLDPDGRQHALAGALSFPRLSTHLTGRDPVRVCAALGALQRVAETERCSRLRVYAGRDQHREQHCRDWCTVIHPWSSCRVRPWPYAPIRPVDRS